MACVDIKHIEVQRLSEELGLHEAVVAAKVALWQEANNEVGKKFPIASELGYIQSKNEQIYSQLGNKTKSNNVEIKSWDELKNATKSITKEGIISTRIQGTNEHFGNPFSHDPSGKTQGLIKTETIKEAVENYITWIQYGHYAFMNNEGTPNEITHELLKQDERREWILKQLNSGDLKNKPIFYYKELKEPSHATVLDYLINKYNWDKNITKITNTDLHQKSILKRISNEYFHYKKASNVFSNLQNLLQLIKGFKSTFAESEKFITALNNLGWSVSENGLDIVKNDKPTDKFYKNYKDTTKIIGNGVSDIFNNDKFLKQSIKTALALTKLSEKYFISQTPTAKKTREDILTLFKDYKAGNVDFQSNLRKHYLSYLTVMAYAESVKNTDDKLPKIEEFLLTPLEEINKDSTKENNELQTNFLQIIDYNYKNGIKNEFLEFLEIKNIDYLKKQANKNTLFGYRFHGFGANSRALKNPDVISTIISSFNDLYFAENNNIISNSPEEKRMNTIKTKFAKDMFKYLVVKDGLMFQNQSFIKAIDPILFTETSNALDKVQELFSKMSSSKEYIETFGMSKEELNLDFIIKFGLNQNNYFDLKSQKIDVLRKTISSEWIKDNKIESEDFVNDNESDTNEKEELVLEDNYPIFFDSKNNTLVVNQFARITKGMKPEEKSRIKKENKKFILRDEIAIFKKIAKTYKSGDKIIPYSKMGFPIITYLSGKDSARIPLKLTAVQDSIQVDGSWINFQISPEGKVLELSGSSKDSLKGDVYYGDLFNNTIYEIINNDAKLKTYKNGKERLVNIAKAIANQFENGYIEGTKALYNQHIILGSGEISSLTNSIKDQLDMVLSPEQTEKVKLNMFNKTKEKAKDETEVRLNFINLINQHSAITKVTLEGTKNRTIEELEKVANNFMVKEGKSKQEIEDKIKKCFGK